ncbi:MAG: sugar transferase, partial [Hyphomicrobium sp.]|uniref:sugar transferase n=1 Tax=Hyphomicrobium sp. TaxID=82 RepID=UPI003D110FC2
IFKFRTMTAGTDVSVHERHVADLINLDQPMTKLDARDSRLVPFGRLFRAAGIDELPQLINVLRGQMSIVGPRPCVECEYERYLPWQLERFNTLPGMTGLWQVSGKNRLTFTEMVDCDIRYARTKSLWLDLKIILMTPPAVINEIRIARAAAKAARRPLGLMQVPAPSAEICELPRAKVVSKPSVQ